MNWERAETATIDPQAFYLVKDNGGEWRDFDLSILKGPIVSYRMRPSIIRGRPEWIAKITNPVTSTDNASDGAIYAAVSQRDMSPEEHASLDTAINSAIGDFPDCPWCGGKDGKHAIVCKSPPQPFSLHHEASK